MKLKFVLPKDNKRHQYCSQCYSENIERISEDGRSLYFCSNCGLKNPRWIVIDPKVKWWIDDQTKEYWHESIGIFLYDKNNNILFLKRRVYPFVFSVPAGHLEFKENPKEAMMRELKEETGIVLGRKDMRLFSEEDIIGDKCCRGADNHHWNVFVAQMDNVGKIRTNGEGDGFSWFSLEDSLKQEIAYPVRFLLEKYGNKIFEA